MQKDEKEKKKKMEEVDVGCENRITTRFCLIGIDSQL